MIVDCQSLECTHIEYWYICNRWIYVWNENKKKEAKRKKRNKQTTNQQHFILSTISDASNTLIYAKCWPTMWMRSMHPYPVLRITENCLRMHRKLIRKRRRSKIKEHKSFHFVWRRRNRITDHQPMECFLFWPLNCYRRKSNELHFECNWMRVQPTKSINKN